MITITNAETLGFSRKYEFSSEGAINYRNIDELSIKVFASDITNTSGLLSGIIALIAIRENNDYQPWTINGTVFDKCKLVDFNTEDGDWVNVSKITLTLSIIKQGQNTLEIGGEYSAIISNYWDIFSSIAESVEISRGPNSTNYSRTITISLNRSRAIVGATDAEIKTAKDVIKQIFDFNKGGGYNYDFHESEPQISDALDDSNFYKTRKEVHDLINNTVSITESFDTENVIDSAYGHSYNIELNIDSKGTVLVSENGKIQGLLAGTDQYGKINSADSKREAVLTDAKTRIQTAFNDWVFADTLPLNQIGGFIVINKKAFTYNIHEGWLEYTVSATNDPSATGHSYGLEISDDGCYGYATEKGRFYDVGLTPTSGQNSIKARHDAAYNNYVAATGLIDARIKTYVACSMTVPYQKSETHDFTEGFVEYSRSFTNNPIYDNGLTVGGKRVKKYEVSKNHNLPVPVSSSAESVGVKEVAQKSNLETPEGASVSISMLLDRILPSDKYNKLTSSVNTSKTIIAGIIPVINHDKILEATYSWSPLNDVTFNIDTQFSLAEEC